MRNVFQEALGAHPGPEFVKLESYEKRDHLLLEHKNFYQSITNKTAPIISLDDGILAVRLIDHVLESVRTGKEVML
jgi:predicted dehydrogenase